MNANSIVGSGIDRAIAVGWELRTCPLGHLLVTKPEFDHYTCDHGSCKRRLWWLFDDPVIEATYRAGGIDAAVIAWLDRHGHLH